MNRKIYQYIIAGFIITIAYLFFLIMKEYFSQFRTDSYISALVAKNNEIEWRNAHKAHFEKYIHTPAYISQTAKTMQNKKLPGEEVINVLEKDDLESNKELNAQEIFTQKIPDNPTLKMTNFEKWQYLLNTGLRNTPSK